MLFVLENMRRCVHKKLGAGCSVTEIEDVKVLVKRRRSGKRLECMAYNSECCKLTQVEILKY